MVNKGVVMTGLVWTDPVGPLSGPTGLSQMLKMGWGA